MTFPSSLISLLCRLFRIWVVCVWRMKMRHSSWALPCWQSTRLNWYGDRLWWRRMTMDPMPLYLSLFCIHIHKKNETKKRRLMTGERRPKFDRFNPVSIQSLFFLPLFFSSSGWDTRKRRMFHPLTWTALPPSRLNCQLLLVLMNGTLSGVAC